MKKIIIAVAIILAGCAANMQQQSVNPYAEFERYIAAKRPLINSGELKRSDYYLGLYEVASRLNNVSGRGALMADINTLIGVSKQYEGGLVTLDELESTQRSISANTAARDDAMAAEERRIANENYLRLREADAARPPYVPPVRAPLPRTTNCQTYGNTTNCTTR